MFVYTMSSIPSPILRCRYYLYPNLEMKEVSSKRLNKCSEDTWLEQGSSGIRLQNLFLSFSDPHSGWRSPVCRLKDTCMAENKEGIVGIWSPCVGARVGRG